MLEKRSWIGWWSRSSDQIPGRGSNPNCPRVEVTIGQDDLNFSVAAAHLVLGAGVAGWEAFVKVLQARERCGKVSCPFQCRLLNCLGRKEEEGARGEISRVSCERLCEMVTDVLRCVTCT